MFLPEISNRMVSVNGKHPRISVVVNIQMSRAESVPVVPEWSVYTLQHGLGNEKY